MKEEIERQESNSHALLISCGGTPGPECVCNGALAPTVSYVAPKLPSEGKSAAPSLLRGVAVSSSGSCVDWLLQFHGNLPPPHTCSKPVDPSSGSQHKTAALPVSPKIKA